MRVKYQWNDGVHYSAVGDSGLPVEIDGPPEIGGMNRGIRPMELMLMGVGGCTAVDVMHILRKARCSVSDCRTTISAERENSDPRVFRRIHIVFELSGEGLTNSRVSRAVELSAEKYCSASIMMKRAGVEVSYDWTIVRTKESEIAGEPRKLGYPQSTLGIHHVALISTRFEESRRFYSELMGMDIEWEPDSDNVYLTSGNDNLAIHRRMSDEEGPDSRLDHIGFIVPHENQVDAWFEFLRGNNVPIAATPKTHRDGSRSCYVLDPDETQVQIIHHPPIVKALS